MDFVEIDNIEQMKERITYWITHDSERNEKIRKNKEVLSSRPNAFSFFFQRFLLAYDRITFDMFYHLVGNYVQLHTNKICLSLPESTLRRKSFDVDNKYGFECFPGLRHQKSWVGCGLSYKMIFTKALEAGMKEIMICEDDVIFPADFESQLDKILAYLHQKKKWSIFSGIMADVGKVKILDYDKTPDFSILRIDHMISTVFNIYNKEMFKYFCNWDERNRDVYKNAIDRYLESKDLDVFIQVPFLVGHKEELTSTIWGHSNIEYTQMIQNSERKLLDMASAYENEKKT
ncbi:MAG: glycosyltransferase family 25 protein [Clostridia bacterium]|nr:glycosyltransferase family 25 protein [Clostridia bacterium]